METITSVVNTVSTTATKAIWGEQDHPAAGNEPVSGVQGKGTATEPYDQGNAEHPAEHSATPATDAPTTSLPIREKTTSASTDLPDHSAKPTIPTSDAFNSAAAANASTAAHTSAITSKPEPSLAGASETPTPGLAGFTNHPSIDPNDETQIPTHVSTTSTSGGDSAGLSGSRNLSDTLTRTDDPAPATEVTNVPVGTAGATGTSNLSDTLSKLPDPAPTTGTAQPSAITETSTPSTTKEADRVIEGSHNADKGVADKKVEPSTSGEKEKEKVSIKDKLKEKLHIGHKH